VTAHVSVLVVVTVVAVAQGARDGVLDVVELVDQVGPISIARLSVPTHWRPGARAMNITADIDKARFARELPLTPRAVDVLERCAPKQGLVFGRQTTAPG
jgi:hypothetical protein